MNSPPALQRVREWHFSMDYRTNLLTSRLHMLQNMNVDAMSMVQLLFLYRDLNNAKTSEDVPPRFWIPFGACRLLEASQLKSTIIKIYRRLGITAPKGFGGLLFDLLDNPLDAPTEYVLSQPHCQNKTVEGVLDEIITRAHLPYHFFENLSEECHQYFSNENKIRQKMNQFIEAANAVRQFQRRLLGQIQVRDAGIAGALLATIGTFAERPLAFTSPVGIVLEVEMNVLCHLSSLVNHPTRDRLRQTHVSIAREGMY